MLGCFNGDWHTRQLRWFVVTLAMLASTTAQAQTVDGEAFASESAPFESHSVYDRTVTGGTPLRIWHSTRGYGKEASDTAIGGRGAFDLGAAVGFTDGQFRISNESRFGANVGGGVRWYGDDFLVGQPRIFGISGWYDGQETVFNNYFNQGGVSFESLGEYVDFRLNANIPFEDQKFGDEQFVTGGLNFSGNSLAQATLIPADVSLRVVDFEIAPRVMNLNLWAYGGGYQMDGNGVSEMGAKAGFRGYITNDLAIDVGVTDDEVFHTNTVFQLIWTPGRTGAGPTSWIHSLADRMREPVYRNTYIATQQTMLEGSVALTGADGGALRIVHVDSSAAEGGDGSFENPFNNLTDIENNTQQGDVILVHAGSQFTDETALLIAEQRLLGEGGNVEHMIATSQLGSVVIPETFAGARTATRPSVNNNTTTDIVNLTQTTADASSFTAMEVSNFDFTGGRNAITTSTGVGAVNINRLAITSTSSDAIALTPITETLSGGGQRVRFSPTIDDVTFTNISGDGILLTDVASLPGGTTSTGTISISDITSTNVAAANAGAGIRLVNGRRTATINGFDWTGGSTGEGALSIENATAQGNVTVSGTNDWTGGVVGMAGLGYAINLDASANAVNVTGTTITNTGGDSIIADGGTANLSFTGRIVQDANNASILDVSNGHDGTMTFTELTAGAGVIRAETGDGLQFNNADGAYTFNDAVVLANDPGSNAGIDVTNGSSGTFAFTDTANTIVNPTGDALVITGSDATFTYEGSITTDATSGRPINIDGNTGGSITIASTVTSTGGQGILVQNNTGGTILFDDQVTLNTAANDAVSILNNTGGSVRFNNIDITTTSGRGFVATSATPGYTVTVAGNDNNITTVSGTALELDTIAAGAAGISFESVTATNATGNGISIENVTGGAVTIGNAGATVGAGGVINSTGGTAVLITNANVTLNGLDVTGATGDGISASQTNTTATNLSINNTNVSGATGVGLNISNVANVSVNTMTIAGAGGDGVNIDHTNAAQSVVRLTDVDVNNAGGIGVDFNRSATATTRLTLTDVDVDNAAAEGIAMDVAGSNTVDITIRQGSSVTNIAGNSAVTLNTTGGAKTVNFLMDSGTFENDSTSATVAIQGNSPGALNTTVTSNIFNNADPVSGRAYSQEVVSGTTRLNLNGNTASNAAATDEILLTQTAGTFIVIDKATIETRNNSAQVQEVGTITDDPGGSVTTPNP